MTISPPAEAARFWQQYDIPLASDTCINQVRSGLLRGSSGTGTNAASVVHLHVIDGFTDGRLSRDSDSYLCENGSHVSSNEQQERHIYHGDQYVPKVTCSSCLDFMERWKSTED